MPAKDPVASPRPQRSRPAATPHRTGSGAALIFGIAVILLATLIAYGPALNAGFIWDDDDMLTENPLVQGSLRDIWFTTKFYDYYPLTLTSLWVEWRLWGMNPTGYHVVNVLLHATTAILFWRVLMRLAIPGAFLAGLVFALHPVNVESVAWIAERKNTLPMVFYALTLLWFVRAEATTDGKTGLFGFSKRHWLALGAFTLALLAKTSVVMLPFVLLGCIWWLRGKIAKDAFLRTIPFFFVALSLALVTIWVQYNRAISTDVVQTSGFAEKLARAGWAVWFYLYKALLPLDLSFVYPRWQVNAQSALSYFPGVALFLWLAVFWKFRQTWGRPLFFGIAYFTVTLFPVLGFFNIYFQKYSFVADHWQYTSIIGVIALVVGLGVHLAKGAQWASAVGGIVAVALGVLTWQQCRIYKNDEALWLDTIKKNPKAAIACQNLGMIEAERGNMEEAQRYFERALVANPEHESAHYSLATCLAMRGEMTKAVQHLREAIRIKPDYSMAMSTLAWVLATNPDARLRNGEEAVDLARRASDLAKGNNPGYLDTLAAAYAEAGNFSEALKAQDRAIEVARNGGDEDMIPELEARRHLYRSRRPFREETR